MASVGNSFDVFDEFLRRKQESQEEAAEIEEVGSASSSSYYEEEIVEEDGTKVDVFALFALESAIFECLLSAAFTSA